MTDVSPRRGGGRAARQAARLAAHTETVPFLTRTLSPLEVLSDESAELIEQNADTILEQVGVIFRDYPDALRLLGRRRAPTSTASGCASPAACAGASCPPRRPPCTPSTPATRRAPCRSAGDATVLAPNYGSPFVHDLDQGRRYATLADFENFVKLTYASPYLHHSGGTVCEPVDVPVNKRHLDMVYAHLRYSDKPFMGSVTAGSRAEDSRRAGPHRLRRRPRPAAR